MINKYSEWQSIHSTFKIILNNESYKVLYAKNYDTEEYRMYNHWDNTMNKRYLLAHFSKLRDYPEDELFLEMI